MSKTPMLLAVVVTAVAVGGGLAVADGGTSDRDVRRSAIGASPGVAALAPQLPELIAAFRRDQDAADRLPGNPVRALEQLGDARPGESPQLARRLETGNGRIYAWPEAGGVCYAWSGSAGCTPTYVLADQGVVVGLRVINGGPDRPEEVIVAGLARDGIQSVTLLFENGGPENVAVKDNGFIAYPSTIPMEVRWTDPGGTPGSRLLPRD
jgi:hypothetical protein